MRNCSIFYGLATIGLSLLNTTSAIAQTSAVPPPAVQTITPSAWGKMAEIKSVDVPKTDVSELLGLHMWQFDIVSTKPAHPLRCILEVQENGNHRIFLKRQGLTRKRDGRKMVI